MALIVAMGMVRVEPLSLLPLSSILTPPILVPPIKCVTELDTQPCHAITGSTTHTNQLLIPLFLPITPPSPTRQLPLRLGFLIVLPFITLPQTSLTFIWTLIHIMVPKLVLVMVLSIQFSTLARLSSSLILDSFCLSISYIFFPLL